MHCRRSLRQDQEDCPVTETHKEIRLLHLSAMAWGGEVSSGVPSNTSRWSSNCTSCF
jgi:hypothetical protein